MFEALNERLTGVFDRITGRGALSEKDVSEAMREVRIALLEADVALPVARRFIDAVTEKAVGQDVLRSVTPGQQVVKIVNDALVEMLGGEGTAELDLAAAPPVVAALTAAVASTMPVPQPEQLAGKARAVDFSFDSMSSGVRLAFSASIRASKGRKRMGRRRRDRGGTGLWPILPVLIAGP